MGGMQRVSIGLGWAGKDGTWWVPNPEDGVLSQRRRGGSRGKVVLSQEEATVTHAGGCGGRSPPQKGVKGVKPPSNGGWEKPLQLTGNEGVWG